MATSLLGLVFWGVAARRYSPEVVGANTALMSAMQLLSMLAQLGMVNVANRFVPTAGRATARLVLTGYVIAFITAMLVGSVFVAGINIWASSLNFIGSNPWLTISFIGATMGWVIFVIQDAVLVGLRQATWVPIENIVFAVAKIVLLFIFVEWIPSYGIFASWVIPSIIIVLPTNFLIFRYLIPRHVRQTAAIATEIKPSEVIRFIFGNYVTTLIWNVTITVLPLVVFSKVGAENSAFFYLPWTIAYSLYLVGANMNMSFLAEVASDSHRLAALSFRTWLQTMRILLPAVLAVFIFAPLVLSLFGGNYVAGGVALLRLLALSSLGYSFTAHYLELARARKRTKDAVIIQAVVCGLALSLGYIFMHYIGITGLGIGWLLAHTTVGVFFAVTKLSRMWLPQLRTSALGKLVPLARKALWTLTHTRINAQALKLVPMILADIDRAGAFIGARHLNHFSVIPTSSEMTVISAGSRKDGREIIIKLPQTETAVATLRHQNDSVSRMRADLRLKDLLPLLPSVVTEGVLHGHHYSVEMLIDGLGGESCAAESSGCDRALLLAASAIRPLHINTAMKVTIDEAILVRWLDKRIAALQSLNMPVRSDEIVASPLSMLASELRASLLGRKMIISWIHGDYWLGNLRVSHDGNQVAGILDWDLSENNSLPFLDYMTLIISTRMLTHGSEIGEVIIDLLKTQNWSDIESAILNQSANDFEIDAIDMRTKLLFTWLVHVTDVLSKAVKPSHNWFWLNINIETVLRTI